MTLTPIPLTSTFELLFEKIINSNETQVYWSFSKLRVSTACSNEELINLFHASIGPPYIQKAISLCYSFEDKLFFVATPLDRFQIQLSSTGGKEESEEIIDLKRLMDETFLRGSSLQKGKLISRLAEWVGSDEIFKYKKVWLEVFESPHFLEMPHEEVTLLLNEGRLRYHASRQDFSYALFRYWQHPQTVDLTRDALKELMDLIDVRGFKSDSIRKEVAEKIVCYMRAPLMFPACKIKLPRYLSDESKLVLISFEAVPINHEKGAKPVKNKVVTKRLKSVEDLSGLPLQMLRSEIEDVEARGLFSSINAMKDVKGFIGLLEKLLKASTRQWDSGRRNDFFIPSLKEVLHRSKLSQNRILYMELLARIGQAISDTNIPCEFLEGFELSFSNEGVSELISHAPFNENPTFFALKLLAPYWDAAIKTMDKKLFFHFIKSLSRKEGKIESHTLTFVEKKRGLIWPLLHKWATVDDVDAWIEFAGKFTSVLFLEQSDADKQIRKEVVKKVYINLALYIWAKWTDPYQKKEVWESLTLESLVSACPDIFPQVGPEKFFASYAKEFYRIQNEPELKLNDNISNLYSIMMLLYDHLDLWSEETLFSQLVLPALITQADSVCKEVRIIVSKAQEREKNYVVLAPALEELEMGVAILLKTAMQKWNHLKLHNCLIGTDLQQAETLAWLVSICNKITLDLPHAVMNDFLFYLPTFGSNKEKGIFLSHDILKLFDSENTFGGIVMFAMQLSCRIDAPTKEFQRLLSIFFKVVDRLQVQLKSRSNQEAIYSPLIFATVRWAQECVNQLKQPSMGKSFKNIEENLPKFLLALMKLNRAVEQPWIYSKLTLQDGEKILKTLFLPVAEKLKQFNGGSLWIQSLEEAYMELSVGGISFLPKVVANQSLDDVSVALYLYAISESYHSAPCKADCEIVKQSQELITTRAIRLLKSTETDLRPSLYILEFLNRFSDAIEVDELFLDSIIAYAKKVDNGDVVLRWDRTWFRVSQKHFKIRKELIDNVFAKVLVRFWKANEVLPSLSKQTHELLGDVCSLYPENGFAYAIFELIRECERVKNSLLIDPLKDVKCLNAAIQCSKLIKEALKNRTDRHVNLLSEGTLAVLFRMFAYHIFRVEQEGKEPLDEQILAEVTELFDTCLKEKLIQRAADLVLPDSTINTQITMFRLCRMLIQRLDSLDLNVIDSFTRDPDIFITNSNLKELLMIDPEKKNQDLAILNLQMHLSSLERSESGFMEIHIDLVNVLDNYTKKINESMVVLNYDRSIFHSIIEKINPAKRKGFKVRDLNRFKFNYKIVSSFVAGIVEGIDVTKRADLLRRENVTDILHTEMEMAREALGKYFPDEAHEIFG